MVLMNMETYLITKGTQRLAKWPPLCANMRAISRTGGSMGSYVSPATVLLHLQREVKSTGLREFCRQHRLDPGNTSRVVNQERPIQRKMAAALGYEECTAYRKVR